MNASTASQRYWDDVREGEQLAAQEFPLSVYRLVVEAGANRDFNAIHHNSEHAQSTGAPEMYANTLFLQGMWEKTVRAYIGLAGELHHLKGFRMGIFNTAGDTVTVKGEVVRKWQDGGKNYLEIKMWSENSKGVSVGPGAWIASLPARG
jgi:acyl dehydratase